MRVFLEVGGIGFYCEIAFQQSCVGDMGTVSEHGLRERPHCVLRTLAWGSRGVHGQVLIMDTSVGVK